MEARRARLRLDYKIARTTLLGARKVKTMNRIREAIKRLREEFEEEFKPIEEEEFEHLGSPDR